jgi:hypothetical protein
MYDQPGFSLARIAFILAGLFCLWYFYSFRTGRNKFMHLQGDTGGRWIVYGIPFAGLMMLFIAFLDYIAPFLPGYSGVLVFIVLGLGIFVTIFWQPEWMKPVWLRWLEQNHPELIPLLRDEVTSLRGQAIFEWIRKVKTQEGFEQWVEEMAHKYKV